MTDEYIRKQDAVNTLWKEPSYIDPLNVLAEARDRIESLEPADVVPVVRCKECKFRENDDFCTGRGFPYQLVPDDGFCDKGERKE